MFKGDTQAMAQSTEYQEMQGDLELLEAFVMLWNDWRWYDWQESQ